jgi:hypothetical protein
MDSLDEFDELIRNSEFVSITGEPLDNPYRINDLPEASVEDFSVEV